MGMFISVLVSATLVCSGLALLMTTISPLIVLYWVKNYPVDTVNFAKQRIHLSALVITIILLAIFGFSIPSNIGNIIIQIITFACLFVLSIFSSSLRPKFLGTLVGAVSFIGLALFLVIFAVGNLLDVATTQNIKIIEIEDSLYCKQSITDFGTNFEVFKRYTFIDKRLVPGNIFATKNKQLSSKAERIFYSCNEAFNQKQ
jgi:hypothetical protein